MKAPFEKQMLGAKASSMGTLPIAPSDAAELFAKIRAVTICGAARE